METVILSEESQREKDKYDMAHMWNIKNGTNELIYKTDINNRCGIHTYGYQEGKGKGGIN